MSPYRSRSRSAAALAALLMLACPALAQRELAGAAEITQAVERLGVLGSVLLVGAHPDDENTALLAYLARGRKLRAAYLSLTRGEGGQNLIGPEQGDLLGVIRTQELLAARRIDGAQQFFTRAIDFGYSKSAEETLAKWGGREAVLGDVVWVIRRFRPDVIILRFSGTSRDGHGHHASSAILGTEAFEAAADPRRYPEQLKHVQPWRARRLVFNTFAFTPQQELAEKLLPGRISVEMGEWDPVAGYSHAEIAGMSRSMHRSQGFGAAERRGSVRNYFVHQAGERAAKDLLDGIDTTWNRVPGGARAGELLLRAARELDLRNPAKTVPALLEARKLAAELAAPLAKEKLGEIDEAIALCAGLWLDAVADRHAVVPGDTVTVRATALRRTALPVALGRISLSGIAGAPSSGPARAALDFNVPLTRSLSVPAPPDQPPVQPFWLEKPHRGAVYELASLTLLDAPENPPLLQAAFQVEIGGATIVLHRPVLYRWVDRVRGELTRPFIVVPRATLRLSEEALVFPDPKPKEIEVQVKAHAAGARGAVRLETPAGWRSDPARREFTLAARDEETVVRFTLTPPAAASSAIVRAVAETDGRELRLASDQASYEHIPPQTVFSPAAARLVRVDAATLARRVGYVMGAGDEIPRYLRQLGCEVTLLDAGDLARADLARFDAIVTGVRAYNTRPDLRANQQRLLAYVEAGGTLLVQYNVLEGGFLGGDPGALSRIGPYPLKIGRDRVSVEEAPVKFRADHPVMRAPNRITAADFDGWIQERGLYFAATWDNRYVSLIESADPGEPARGGGTLFARHGKGVFVFSSYSWFRQLPAGVPGAFRIFANLISAGKASR